MKKFLALITLLIFSFGSAYARPIISGISSNKINIDTNFTGTEILLFGAKGGSGDIIIAIRGPKKDYMVSKKEKTLGVWHNGKRVKFEDTYSYYNIFSTFGNKVRKHNLLLSELELGEGNIKFTTNIKDQDRFDEFSVQLIDKLEKEKLYSANAQKIDFLDEGLFKIIINFPKNIVRGVYSAEIYLIDDNNLEAFQTIPIFVNQVGLSARIDDMAHNRSFLYATISVLIAVVAGFLANYVFTRFFSR